MQKLAEIVDANERARMVEKRVMMIQKMWEDFEFLVALNSAKIQRITDAIKEASDFIAESVTNMEEAKEYQDKANAAKNKTMMAGACFFCIAASACMCCCM